MRKLAFAIVFLGLVLAMPACSQQAPQREAYDLASFVAPAGWTREVKERSSTSFTTTNQVKQTYCRIIVYMSTKGKGSLDEDFAQEWKTLILGSYAVKAPPAPVTVSVSAAKGWSSKAGSGTFEFNGGVSNVQLVTWSGHQRIMSVVAVTSDDDFQPAIASFLQSMELRAPDPDNAPAGGVTTTAPPAPAAPAAPGRFKFTTTNFDDGWVATEQPDWVRASKGDVTVLIHYTPEDKPNLANVDETTGYFWKKLVASRYRNASNVWFRRSFWSDGDAMTGIYFASADAEEVATGRRVHVVLFKRGNAGKWLEIITPDKASFEKQFGVVYAQDGTDWNRMGALGNYNKFAVAADDLVGTWKSSSGAGIEYYNVYTGSSLGMATSSSTDEFVFEPGGSYRSVSKIVMGTGANLKYGSESYAGAYTEKDWEMTLTERFKGRTETYKVAFEAVKGGRILHMVRDATVDYHLFRVK